MPHTNQKLFITIFFTENICFDKNIFLLLNIIAFDNGEYLRLPTEKEIFGENKYGEEEGVEITQFECIIDLAIAVTAFI